ncbi:glycosyltransferase family 1 protein [Siculibacillus lacustris]|uniref:Glycosyltransferase family 1 protein n=1 Tax=Siculibacillus lacustris TaxID=1549641 RepID=A0A4Q9VS39_9HYPH|nr:glycosyltransferase family 4 protein [Siculibacillus lacustris]TBW38767.1 glycosyltransferase family 1 protein [Siculibacillus lacustris]
MADTPDTPASPPAARPRTVLMIQTQAENAGAQEISRLVGAGLARRGHAVRHLFFYSRTGGATDLGDVEVCVAARPGNPLAFARFLVETRRRIARIAPDVVLTFQHWGNVLGAPLSRLAGVPAIVANQVSATEVTNGPLRIVDRALGRFGLYDRITVNSDETARLYAGHPAAYRARIVAIPHGFERKKSPLDRAEARRRLDLPQDVELLGCAARLHPTKRLDAAVRLLARMPDRHLALAGQGPDLARLTGFAHELGVAARVHFVGELQPTRVGDFLAALDVFVFPTAAETFGLAGVEAAQAGIPVVAADLPVLREVLACDGAAAALFVDPTDGAAFAAAVDRIFADPGLAADLRRAGAGLDRRFSLDAMVDAYARLIDDVTGGGMR